MHSYSQLPAISFIMKKTMKATISNELYSSSYGRDESVAYVITVCLELSAYAYVLNIIGIYSNLRIDALQSLYPCSTC